MRAILPNHPSHPLPWAVEGSATEERGQFPGEPERVWLFHSCLGPYAYSSFCHLKIFIILTRGSIFFTLHLDTKLCSRSFWGTGSLPIRCHSHCRPSKRRSLRPECSTVWDTGWFLGPHTTVGWWCPAPDVITQITSSCDQDPAILPRYQVFLNLGMWKDLGGSILFSFDKTIRLFKIWKALEICESALFEVWGRKDFDGERKDSYFHFKQGREEKISVREGYSLDFIVQGTR